MADLWRIRLARGTPNSGGGEWEYYEDFERMSADLLDFALEAAAEDRKSDAAARISRRVRSWRKHKQGVEEEEYYRVRRIVSVDRMVGDEWVELGWRLVPPSVVIEEPS